MTIKILIADDHEIVREGVRTLVGRSRPEWQICGEASSGEQAIQAVKVSKPDVALLDITMPGMSGLAAASQINKLNPGCHVLIFTMHESEAFSAEARRIGARGYVLKSQAARDLIRAIDRLLAGGTFFDADPEPKRDWRPPAMNIVC
jgi:DNA-binding NarL/FixJ family response regulator